MKKNIFLILTGSVLLISICWLFNFSRFQNNMKTTNIYQLASNNLFSKNQVTLSIPTNLTWKKGSAATVKWDAIENANYYLVNVFVYKENVLIGQTETGTSSNELDIQQEINYILNETNFNSNTFLVSYNITAMYIYNGETIISNESCESVKKTFDIGTGIVKMETPTNVSIDDNYNATWTATTGAEYYWITFEINGKSETLYGQMITTNYSSKYSYGTVTGNVFGANIEKAVADFYSDMVRTKQIQSGQTVELKFNVQAIPGAFSNSNYIESDVSENSRVFNYTNSSLIKMETPTNVSIDDDYNATWTATTGAEYYWLTFEINGKMETLYGQIITTNYSSEYSYGTVTGNVFSANIEKAIADFYSDMVRTKQIQSGQTVELKFNVQAILGAFSNSNYIESDVSENSRVFNYTNSSLIKMETPTNVSVDDNYNATWTATTGANYYWLTFEINGKMETLYGQMITTNYSSEYSYGTVSGNVFSANIEKAIADFYSDMVRTKQIQSGQTVELKFNVQAIPGAFSNSNYIESEYSSFSSKFYYNSDGSTKIDLITLSPNQPVVAIGKFLYIGKTIIPEKAYYSRIEWSSNNNAIVSIDSMGKITGIKKGQANINAKINNATQSALVSVYEINSNFKNENSSEKVLDAATGIINSIIIDENTKNTDIRNVKDAINEIEIGAQNGNEFKVELNNTKKNKESFDSVESQIKGLHSDMNIAGGYDIRVGISHEDNEGIKHHIGNITEFEDKITFDIDLLSNIPVLANTKIREYQLVRYHDGQLVDVETTINSNGTISTASNKFSDFILLYKDTDIPVSGISVNETDLLLDIGSTEIVNVTINPSNAENKNYSSMSNDATIATINGNSITAVGIGTTKITFTTEDGRYSKEIKITVKSPLKSISLNKISGIINVGEQETLTLTYNPINTTDNKTISWTTSNNAIVTVNNGIVTAVGVGNAIITARVGSKYATCNIIVKSPLKSISLNKTSGIINVGAKEALTVIYNPSNTTDSKEVTWQSDNSTIATVSNGIVVGLKEGSTTITAKVGNITATYQVNVNDMRLNDIVNNLNYKLTDKFIHGFVLNETFNNIKLKFGTDVIINSRTSIVGTGTQISYRGETIIAVIYGDISGDGLINSADLLKMRQHLLGTNSLIGEYRQAASLVNGNLINSADLLRLRQYLLGINTINQ